MKEIKLTQNRVAIVDDDDFERLNQYKWHAYMNRNTFYAIRQISKINGEKATISMHREIMNTPKDIQIDHKFGNGLDNRKDNLRLCTQQENRFNQKNPNKNNKLGIKGIRWYKRTMKFQAKIQVYGKTIHLGYFNVSGDADSAYRKAEEKYFGKFARKY